MKPAYMALALLPFAWIGAVTSANAGCLTSLTTTASVFSKVRGLYVAGGSTNPAHYLIVDKGTCQADASGDVTLGAPTKSAHYLRLRDGDKVMLSTLLAAQAQGLIVQFRLMPGAPNADGYNEIAYVISPSSAIAQ